MGWSMMQVKMKPITNIGNDLLIQKHRNWSKYKKLIHHIFSDVVAFQFF